MQHTLREWRRRKEITQLEVAKRVGVSLTTVNKWEEHPERMTVERVCQYAKAIEVPMDDISFDPSIQHNVENATTV